MLLHFRTRYLTAAFDAWHRWQRRKSYLAAVFAQLEGRGHQQASVAPPHKMLRGRWASSSRAYQSPFSPIACSCVYGSRTA